MTTVVQYEKPDLPVAGDAEHAAMRVIIDDQFTYELASKQAVAMKERRDEIEAMRKSIVDPINKAKDAVQAMFTPVTVGYDSAIRIIKAKMVHYVNEQAEKQRLAQAEADRIARAAAEAAEKAAAKLEKKGKVEEAEAIREIAAVAAAPVVAPMVEQVGGNSVRKVWKTKLVDLQALAAFIAEHPDYINLISYNQSAGDRLAAAVKGKIRIGGVQVYEDSIVALRSGAK